MASLFDPMQARRLHPYPLFRRRPLLRHLLACVFAGGLWTLALPATATEPIPGHSLESIRTWVLEHNPELRAMDFETQAAEARILPAGALPDPMASVGFRGLDPDKPWRTAGAEREVNYALRQRFPLWGKRGLARTAASQDAAAVGLDRVTTARDLLSDAEAAYARYWHADQAVAVLDRRIALLRQVEEMAGVRYALGRAAQQDAIRAQVEQTSLQRERIERIATKQEAAAMLNAVLGRPMRRRASSSTAPRSPRHWMTQMRTPRCARSRPAPRPRARTWYCSVATAFPTSPWAWVRCSTATASKAPS